MSRIRPEFTTYSYTEDPAKPRNDEWRYRLNVELKFSATVNDGHITFYMDTRLPAKLWWLIHNEIELSVIGTSISQGTIDRAIDVLKNIVFNMISYGALVWNEELQIFEFDNVTMCEAELAWQRRGERERA